MSITEILLWTGGVLFFILVLLISIGLHEAGHASVAKLFKLEVPKFFIGFGRKNIWSSKNGWFPPIEKTPKKKKPKKGEPEEPEEELPEEPFDGKTEYGIKAIPLGGFVVIQDPNRKRGSYDSLALTRVNPLKRILVFLAGPAVNIVLGIAILMSVFLIYPYSYVSNEIKSVDTCEVAKKEKGSCTGFEGGMQKKDHIREINGTKVTLKDDFAELLVGKESVDVVVERNGENVLLSNVGVDKGKFGINMKIKERDTTVEEAWTAVENVIIMNAKSIIKLHEKIPPLVDYVFKGADRDPESPSSIIVVGKVYGDTAASDEIPAPSKIQIFLTLAGFFNLAIGFINLLPIFPLDGGRILIAFFDIFRSGWSKIRKKEYNPTPEKFVGVMALCTTAVLLGFMLLVVASDIIAISQGLV